MQREASAEPWKCASTNCWHCLLQYTAQRVGQSPRKWKGFWWASRWGVCKLSWLCGSATMSKMMKSNEGFMSKIQWLKPSTRAASSSFTEGLGNQDGLQERPTRSAMARSANEEMDWQYKLSNRLAPPDGWENGNRARQLSMIIIMIAKCLLRHMPINKEKKHCFRPQPVKGQKKQLNCQLGQQSAWGGVSWKFSTKTAADNLAGSLRLKCGMSRHDWQNRERNCSGR